MQSNYQKLIVWQKAIELSTQLYKISKSFPKEEIYGLTNQMRRAAISIASNIAEGSGRNGNGEYIHFLGIAKGSCNELETQIIIAGNLQYLNESESKQLLELCESILKILTAIITKHLNPPL